MKPRLLTAVCSLVLLIAPAVSHAADDLETNIDGRLEGYTKKVALPDSSTTGSWFVFAILSAVAVGVLFKNANRSHLD